MAVARPGPARRGAAWRLWYLPPCSAISACYSAEQTAALLQYSSHCFIVLLFHCYPAAPELLLIDQLSRQQADKNNSLDENNTETAHILLNCQVMHALSTRYGSENSVMAETEGKGSVAAWQLAHRFVMSRT